MLMNNALIFFGVILLLGLCLVFYKYSHRNSLHENVDQLRKVIDIAFKEAEKPVISQNRLIKELKHHLGVNEKMALRLIGKARHENLLEVDHEQLKEKDKVYFKKTF